MSVMEGVHPEVNQFEQISSDGHQMSLVEEREFPCPMSEREPGPEAVVYVPWLERGKGPAALSSNVQCIVHNGNMGTSP